MNIIGICGWKGVGKDTAGKYFLDHQNYVKDSFAKSLKDMASAVFNWDRDLLEGLTENSREWREQPDEWWESKLNWDNHPGSKLSPRFTPRFALQYLGTQVFRDKFHDDLWVSSMESRLRNKSNVVITDCRFPNELQMIKNLGGTIIWVRRGENPGWYNDAFVANKGLKWDNKDPKQYPYSKDFGLLRMRALQIHESEWKWIGWDFDHVVGNNGSILDLYNNLQLITNK